MHSHAIGSEQAKDQHTRYRELGDANPGKWWAFSGLMQAAGGLPIVLERFYRAGLGSILTTGKTAMPSSLSVEAVVKLLYCAGIVEALRVFTTADFKAGEEDRTPDIQLGKPPESPLKTAEKAHCMHDIVCRHRVQVFTVKREPTPRHPVLARLRNGERCEPLAKRNAFPCYPRSLDARSPVVRAHRPRSVTY